MRRPRRIWERSQIYDPDADSNAVFFLSSVGVPDSHIVKVLEKRPRVKFLDVERCVQPTFEFLLGQGLHPLEIGEAYVNAPLLVGLSVDTVLRPVMAFLTEDIQMDPREAFLTLSLEPELLRHSPAVLRRRTALWEEAGVRRGDVLAEVRRNPRRLFADEDDMAIAGEAYARLGLAVGSPAARRLFREDPDLLFAAFSSSFNDLVAFLEETSVPVEARGRIVTRCRALLRASYENDLSPKLFFLLGWGISRPQIGVMCRRDPAAFAAPLLLWHSAAAALQRAGLDARGVARLLRRAPGVLAMHPEDEIAPRLRFLEGRLGLSLEEAARCPALFRRDLGALEARLDFAEAEGRAEGLAPADLARASDDRFAACVGSTPKLFRAFLRARRAAAAAGAQPHRPTANDPAHAAAAEAAP
eukprot:tig00000144_g9148.t1